MVGLQNARADDVPAHCAVRSMAALLLLLLIGTILRFAALDGRSLWYDETYSLQVASASVGSIVAGAVGDRATPPLYYVILHAWMRVFGTSESALRSLSAAFGVASIAAMFLAGSALLGTRVGLISATLIAFSPFHIYYAQEARMYTLVTTLTLMSTYLLIRGLQRDDNRIWTGYVAFAVLSMYTHYYAFFVLAAQNIFVLTFWRTDRRWIRKWALIQSLIVLSYLPWVGALVQLAGGGGQTFRKHLFAMIPYAFFRFSAGYSLLPTNYWMKQNVIEVIRQSFLIVALVVAVFAPVLIHGIWKVLKRNPRIAALTLLFLFLPGLAALLISLRFPMLSERYLIVSTPAYFVLVALSLEGRDGLVRRGLAVVGVGAVFGFSLYVYYFSNAYGKEQWRAAAAYVEAAGRSTDMILFDVAYVRPSFDYYYKGNLQQYGLPQPDGGAPENTMAKIKGHNRIWLVRAHQPSEFWTNWLSSKYRLIDQRTFPLQTGIRLYRFEPYSPYAQGNVRPARRGFSLDRTRMTGETR